MRGVRGVCSVLNHVWSRAVWTEGRMAEVVCPVCGEDDEVVLGLRGS